MPRTFAVVLLLASAFAATASADAPRSSLEFAWRWAGNPVATDGFRVLDTVELGARLPVSPRWSLYPHAGYGVSYGKPWYMLGAVGLEAVYAPVREGFVPRVGFGLSLLGEGISRQGQRVFRDSFEYDVALTVRGGGDYLFRNALVGFDVRLAVAPMARLDVAGPLDVGAALRLGLRLPWRRSTRAPSSAP